MDSRKKLVVTKLVVTAAFAVSVLTATTSVAQMRIDVDQAVETALQKNWGFKQNEATIAGAAASKSQSLVGMLPSASGSYTYQKSKTDDTGKNQPLLFETDNEGNPTNVLNSGDLITTSESGFRTWSVNFREDLSLSQWYNYKSAGQNVDAAHLGRDAAAQDLAYTVRTQFYLALRAEALLIVQNEDFDLAQNEFDRTQTMYELGSVPKVDVYKAEVRVADAEVALIRQRNAVELEHARLATLLGMQPTQRFDLVGDLSGLDSVVDSTQAMSDALTRPDLRQAEMNLRSANTTHRASTLSRVPGVFASFNVGGTAGTSE
ncbi:MAG: TolC family protein, partial [Candidatus Eisenbacteria bacterium]|nr:TolC family protein [Candidatus Eisenbacteria bacterium]